MKKELPSEENLALTANTKKGKGKKFPFQKNKGRKFKGNRRQLDMSKIRCYECQKFGHFAKDCYSNKRKGRHHASTTDLDDEPQHKKARESDLDKVAKDIRKEYYLISALSETITNIIET